MFQEINKRYVQLCITECDFESRDNSALSYHIMIHADEKPFMCCIRNNIDYNCIQVLKGKPNFAWRNVHSNFEIIVSKYVIWFRDVEEKPFHCPQCDKDYSTTTNINGMMSM